MAGIFLLALLVAARFAPYNHGARLNASALHSKPYPRCSGGYFLSASFGILFAFFLNRPADVPECLCRPRNSKLRGPL